MTVFKDNDPSLWSSSLHFISDKPIVGPTPKSRAPLFHPRSTICPGLLETEIELTAQQDGIILSSKVLRVAASLLMRGGFTIIKSPISGSRLSLLEELLDDNACL
jgi:hypothetical protein